MKAVVLTGIRRMELTEAPAPTLEKNTDVLLKIEKVGVCGSDVHYYQTGRIGSQVVEYPFIVGHECTATVQAVGSAVQNVKPGDRVFVEPAIACHNCDQCTAGRRNTCRNLKFLGCPGQVEGCLREYMLMPAECCLPIDDKIDLDLAVLSEPMAIGLYAVRQAHLADNHDIAILGAGPIGLSCLLVAKTQNARKIFVTEKVKEREQVAARAAATWVANPETCNIVGEILERSPAGMDAVFECAGQQETIDQAVELLKPGGKLMLIGIPRTQRVSFNIDYIRRKEITIINVRRQNRCTQACIDLIASGKIRPEFMITHRFELEQTRRAFDMVADYRDGVIKALIEL